MRRLGPAILDHRRLGVDGSTWNVTPRLSPEPSAPCDGSSDLSDAGMDAPPASASAEGAAALSDARPRDVRSRDERDESCFEKWNLTAEVSSFGPRGERSTKSGRERSSPSSPKDLCQSRQAPVEPGCRGS